VFWLFLLVGACLSGSFKSAAAARQRNARWLAECPPLVAGSARVRRWLQIALAQGALRESIFFQVGHVLVARKGKSVYAYSITGFTMEDPSMWSELLDDRVNHLVAEE
jgi:hypothetical protein